MKNLLISIMLFQTLLFSDAISIDAEIQKIQSASPQKRVELMNAFKQKVSKMNREERSLVLKKMQTKMHRRGENREGSEIAKYQNMNQHQAGNQVAKKKGMNSQGVKALHKNKR